MLEKKYQGEKNMGIAFLNFQLKKVGLISKENQKDPSLVVMNFAGKSLPEIEKKLLMKSFGIDPFKADLYFVKNDQNAIDALRNKKADFAIISSSDEKLFKEFTTINQNNEFRSFRVIYSNEDTLKKMKTEVIQFLNDMNRTFVFIKENKEETIKILKKHIQTFKDPEDYYIKLVEAIDLISFIPEENYLQSMNDFVAKDFLKKDPIKTNMIISKFFAKKAIDAK
ncbi:MAG: hypothetical protein PHS92_02740 [Candidatus Gracilibacteria bacterium]|nr:hypothetical protein [Candidatus Gracilibacteria bacterium]